MLPLNALKQMKSPRDKREGIWRNGVLQIWVTRACDKACYGCTQGSNLGGRPGMITVDQFEEACKSLTGYFGVVGMFGGNPCIHPNFAVLCEIMADYIPWEQRGIWTNNMLGKGAVVRHTFNPAISNINVHQDQKAYDEFKRDWPEAHVKGMESDSRHSPPFVAMADVIPSEEERWELIANCDVNQRWSALIGVSAYGLRGWFCELAGAQAMLHGLDYPDTGCIIQPGWWNHPIDSFEEQVRFHCHRCGIPLRGHGALANGGPTEQVSKEHLHVYKPKTKGRIVEVIDAVYQLNGTVQRATDYIENGAADS